MTAALLSIRDLDLFYGDAAALEDVAIDVAPGAIVCIVGANGAGKSSLIRTIQGIEKPRRGSITFKGQDITGWPSHKVTDLGIGQVAEGRQIFAGLTVEENLEVGAFLPRGRAGKAAVKDRVYQMFPKLAQRRGQFAGTMSGGEQQMLAIGRILRTGATLLLLDEPTEGLAPVIVQKIGEVLQALKKRGFTILLVEQNFRFAAKFADRHYVMEDGRVIDHLTAGEIEKNIGKLNEYLGV